MKTLTSSHQNAMRALKKSAYWFSPHTSSCNQQEKEETEEEGKSNKEEIIPASNEIALKCNGQMGDSNKNRNICIDIKRFLTDWNIRLETKLGRIS